MNVFRLSFLIILYYNSLFNLSAQPRSAGSFSMDDIADFRHISEETISKNSRLMAWKSAPVEGDATITLLNNDTRDTITLQRADKVYINESGTYALAVIKPTFQDIRAAKLAKKSKDKWPKDILIRISSTFKIDTVGEIEKLYFPNKTAEYAYFTTAKRPEPVKDSTSTDSAATPTKKPKEPKEKPLYCLHLSNGDTTFVGYAADVAESADGLRLLFTQKSPETGSERKAMYLYNASTKTVQLLDSAAFDYKKLLLSDKGSYLSWLSISDSVADPAIWHWTLMELRKNVYRKVFSDTLLNGKYFNSYGRWTFSESENRLYLTLYTDRPLHEKPDTTKTDDEKPEFDLYTHTDYYLMTWQLANTDQLKAAGITVLYDLRRNKPIYLTQTPEEMAYYRTDVDQPWILTARNAGLDAGRNWEFPNEFTYFLVNASTGQRVNVVSNLRALAELSPSAKYVLWFDRSELRWKVFRIRDQRTYTIAADIGTQWHDLDHDVPSPPPAYGKAGFTANDSRVWLYDRHHIYAADPEGKQKTILLTTFSDTNHSVRYQPVYRREHYIGENSQNVYLLQRNLHSLEETLISFNTTNNLVSNRRKLNKALHRLQGGEYGQWLLLREESYLNYPEIQTISTDLARIKKWTNTGSQYEGKRRGNVRSFTYSVRLSNDSVVQLRGLVYIDEQQRDKIPAIVYYYERSSDNLHRHYAPRFSRSIINSMIYVSHGYAVIIPDITYSTSNPGQDGLRCVNAAVDEALRRWPQIDSSRLGLNGQSWGGYQTAYIITQTNRFKAAFAGAPVANMTSAYGGIRWGTGHSRITQYEEGQSRIGASLWDDPQAYIRNSPLFYLPNVTTPLLIMHNDRDGAVPYYQGIELFMGLKRLGKPVWMLIYNKEDHNLTQLKNMKDLTLRTLEFYNHFLKGEPMPTWMKDGIPAHRKGL
ncbi:alpha/beta hydrolase family protein [Thermaurantimonas aggregans]|nr:prolyl oligopeptidase family serine peptidase [Thermaurantimonas aggregans]